MKNESVEMQSNTRKHAWSKVSIKTQVIVLFPLGILGYICIHLVGDSGFVQRRLFVRLWNCFACGLLSIAGAHLLFPDANLFLVQAVNLNRWQLITRQFRKFSLVLMLLALPPIVLVFYRINDFTAHFFDGIIIVGESWLFIFSIGCYTFQKFALIGQKSQELREGKRKFGYGRIPHGLFATWFATVVIFVIGFHLVVLGVALHQIYRFDLEWLPGVILLGWVVVRMRVKIRAYDRHFYCTNAFYQEAYATGFENESGTRESVIYTSLFWVPKPWRPHVWASLIQLDRRIPLGIVMVLGHIFLWMLFYFYTAMNRITAYLLLLLVVKNAASYVLISRIHAPVDFQALIQSPMNWVVTRIFVNLRWTFLFVLSLTLIAWMWERYTLFQVLYWLAIDLSLTVLSAFLLTVFHETPSKRRYE